jgi:hypothetical protein
MNKNAIKIAAAVVLSLIAIGTLYWSFTRTEEVRLILSKAILKGKVSYKGKPVPNAFVIASGNPMASTCMSDARGNYLMLNAPVGNVMIAVNTDAGKGMMRGAMMASAMGGDKSTAPSFVDLPSKFFDPVKSGIETDVKNKDGENVYNIELH